MGEKEAFESSVADFFDGLSVTPAIDSFPLTHYPIAFRVPLILIASLLGWAFVISGMEANASHQRVRQIYPSFHPMEFGRLR